MILIRDHIKFSQVMLAREEPSAEQRVQFKRSIPPGYVDPLLHTALFFPLYRYPVRPVFRADAQEFREAFWPQLFKADETNARNRFSFIKFRTKRGR